jgi:hypothetical protein
MIRVATAIRVARVAVGEGEGVMVGVAVAEGVKVAVAEGAIVKLAVTETIISGCLLFFLAEVLLSRSRYAKPALMEATRLNIPMMNNHFFTPKPHAITL